MTEVTLDIILRKLDEIISRLDHLLEGSHNES